MPYPEPVDRFAIDIKTARQDRLLTQWDLALQVGVTAREVTEWEELGVTPTPEQCAKLATLLGVTVPGNCAEAANTWKLVKRRAR